MNSEGQPIRDQHRSSRRERERRKQVNEADYLGQILAAGKARIAAQLRLVAKLDKAGYQHESRMGRELLATITETNNIIALRQRSLTRLGR